MSLMLPSEGKREIKRQGQATTTKQQNQNGISKQELLAYLSRVYCQHRGSSDRYHFLQVTTQVQEQYRESTVLTPNARLRSKSIRMDLLFELSRPYREVLFFARLSILGKGVLPLAQQLHKNGIARVLYYKSTNSMKFLVFSQKAGLRSGS